MDADRWQRIRTLLEAARELPEKERAAFLTRECGGDDELRREVESLLAAGEEAGSFLGDTVDSRSISSGPDTTPVPEAIGGYRIVRKLGSGGMGVVYEAEQQSPLRRVALKVVRGGQFVDESRVRLFQREAETLARLKHPIVLHRVETPISRRFRRDVGSGSTCECLGWRVRSGRNDAATDLIVDSSRTSPLEASGGLTLSLQRVRPPDAV